MRWEVSGRSAVALLGAASRICSKQHIASLRSSNLAFSASVSLESKLYNHRVVRIRQQFASFIFHETLLYNV